MNLQDQIHHQNYSTTPPQVTPSSNTTTNHQTTKRIKKSSSNIPNNPQSRNQQTSSSRKRPYDSISNSHPQQDDSDLIDHSNPLHRHNPSHPHHHHHHHNHHHHHHHHPSQSNHLNHHHHVHQHTQPPGNQIHHSLPPTEEDFPMIRCGWNDCRQGFWILEDLINHLVGENGHVPLDPTAPRGQKCPCEWTGCPKQGKPQGSRMALLVHLRSHTGEKPFSCHKPECDKTFSRTDALAKHVRVSHGEILPSLRSSSSNNNNNNNNSLKTSSNSNSSVHNNVTAKKVKVENDSEEEENEEPNQFGGLDRSNNHKTDQKPEKELIDVINENGKCFNEYIDSDLRTEEERKCLEDLKAKLPSNDFAFLEFLVLKAKIKFALGEREIMKTELNLLKSKEEDLHQQKDLLLDEIMKHKIGMESSSLWRSTIENDHHNHHNPATHNE